MKLLPSSTLVLTTWYMNMFLMNLRHVGHLVTIIRGEFRDFFPLK